MNFSSFGRGFDSKYHSNRDSLGKSTVVYAEGLFFPVGERAPNPFERAEAEMAQPDRADAEIHNPDEYNNSVKLVTLKLPEKPKAVAIEDDRADD